MTLFLSVFFVWFLMFPYCTRRQSSIFTLGTAKQSHGTKIPRWRANNTMASWKIGNKLFKWCNCVVFLAPLHLMFSNKVFLAHVIVIPQRARLDKSNLNSCCFIAFGTQWTVAIHQSLAPGCKVCRWWRQRWGSARILSSQKGVFPREINLQILMDLYTFLGNCPPTPPLSQH